MVNKSWYVCMYVAYSENAVQSAMNLRSRADDAVYSLKTCSHVFWEHCGQLPCKSHSISRATFQSQVFFVQADPLLWQLHSP